MDVLIRGGRVIDPVQGIDSHRDVWIVGGKIADIGFDLRPPMQASTDPGDAPRVIEARGCIVAPGFIDMHTHLREPGFEYKETIATGLAAAAVGGFTAVAAMANTHPVNDTPAVTEFMLRRAATVHGTRLYPVGAVSVGLQGKELAEIGGMHNAGIVALSDDGMPVMNARLMRRALEYGRMLGLPVLSHCEDHVLSAHGVMHEGIVSTALGLPGTPAAGGECHGVSRYSTRGADRGTRAYSTRQHGRGCRSGASSESAGYTRDRRSVSASFYAYG